jgi:hypothetical protein
MVVRSSLCDTLGETSFREALTLLLKRSSAQAEIVVAKMFHEVLTANN